MAAAVAVISGGAKLEAKLREIAKQAKNSATVRVGILENATYPDGTPVAMVGAVHVYGAPAAGIPPRDFMRPTVAENSAGWGDAVARILPTQNYDAKATLALVGEGIASQIRSAIIALDSPALSPVTLMLRKMKAANPNLQITAGVVAEAREKVAKGESSAGASSKPLVDTGVLLNSISSEVT